MTISDVARHAGVSTTAVSRALNLPRSQTRISEETHQLIRKAADDLGYQPNWSARALAKGRTGNIGVLYAGGNPLLNRAHDGLNKALSQFLGEHHYRLLLVPVDIEDADWRVTIEQGRVDGCVISSPGMPEALLQTLVDRQIPTVLMNLDLDVPLPRVLADDADGIRQASDHLVNLGHRRIAYLYTPQFPQRPSVQIRQRGFVARMAELNLTDQSWVFAGEAAQFVGEWQARPPEQRPSGVVCYSNVEAFDLYHALWQADIRVPTDLSVIAFNNLYPVEMMTPPLTTMALPFEQMGQLAAEWLVQLLNKSPRPAGSEGVQRILLPQQVIVRQSTAAPADISKAI